MFTRKALKGAIAGPSSGVPAAKPSQAIAPVLDVEDCTCIPCGTSAALSQTQLDQIKAQWSADGHTGNPTCAASWQLQDTCSDVLGFGTGGCYTTCPAACDCETKKCQPVCEDFALCKTPASVHGAPAAMCCINRTIIRRAARVAQRAPTRAATGDPMFKINGTGRHFWIKEGEDTPLLAVGDIVLSGSTFSRKDTGHQWRAPARSSRVLLVRLPNRAAAPSFQV